MIKAKELIENAFSIDDAEKIFSEIEKELAKNGKIVIDFSQIDYYTTLFFNNAITRYVLSMGKDKYDKTFEIINLSDVGKTTYDHSLENAMSLVGTNDQKINEIASIVQKNVEESE